MSQYLWQVVAEIGLFLQYRDQPILDLQEDSSTGFDVLMDCAVGLDLESIAPASLLAPESITIHCMDSRLGWVGIKIDIVDCDEVVLRVGTELQMVSSCYLYPWSNTHPEDSLLAQIGCPHLLGHVAGRNRRMTLSWREKQRGAGGRMLEVSCLVAVVSLSDVSYRRSYQWLNPH